MNVLVRGRIPKVVGLAEAIQRMARASPRRSVAPLALSAGADRASARGLGRLSHRLSQPRQGHQDHPQGGRAEAGPDEDLQAVPTCRPMPSSICGCAICAGSRRWKSARKTRTLRAEKKSIEELLRSEKQQWKKIAEQVREVRDRVRAEDAARQAPHRFCARRRRMTRPRSRRPWSSASRSPSWCRRRAGSALCAARSPIFRASAFKADDGLKLAFFAETTSKLLVFATNGRFYTIDASKLPGGRGHGEPIRLFVDLEQEADIVTVFRYQGGRKLIVASKSGQGIYRSGGRVPRQYAQGQAGAQRQAARRSARDRAGRGRIGRRDRREPQDGGVPASIRCRK